MELERSQGRQSMEPPPPRLCDESPVAESSEPSMISSDFEQRLAGNLAASRRENEVR